MLLLRQPALDLRRLPLGELDLQQSIVVALLDVVEARLCWLGALLGQPLLERCDLLDQVFILDVERQQLLLQLLVRDLLL
jgi:hypothetical protein